MLRIGLTAFAIIFMATGAHAIKGDLIADGQVNFDDFFAFADDFGKSGAPFEVLTVPDDVPEAQAAVDSMGKYIQTAIDSVRSGGIVYIAAGTYILERGLHINRSDISVIGDTAGVVLRLADAVDQPVFLIGDDAIEPTRTVQNITLKHLEIDGNRSAQTSEYDSRRDWIRNNGIDVRKVHNLLIRDVDVHHARSGGIVVSWASEQIFIDNVSAHENQFDGIALYASKAIHLSHFSCNENVAAGLSLDNSLGNVTFSNGECLDNGSVGIFARHSKELIFHRLVIERNVQHGAFFSYDSDWENSGVNQIRLLDCRFAENGDKDIWMGGIPVSSSKGNHAIGCTLDEDKVWIEEGAELGISP